MRGNFSGNGKAVHWSKQERHLSDASFKHISENPAPRVRRLLALRHAAVFMSTIP
jgi:hypothetical protein